MSLGIGRVLAITTAPLIKPFFVIKGGEMSKVKEIQIRCLDQSCNAWFNSPIFFGDSESFDTSTLIGNTVQCPKCGRMTPCNKENMRVRAADGGFVGIDT